MRKIIAVLAIVLAIGALALPALSEDFGVPARKAATQAKQAVKVSGTVVDSGGKPLPKARISIELADQSDVKPVIVYTDKAGKFSTSVTAPAISHVVIQAEAQDCIGYFGRCPLQNASSLSIKLAKAGKFKGVIVDEDGRPLEGARVKLDDCYGYGDNGSNYTSARMSDEQKSVTTGKDGIFVFSNVPRLEDYQYLYAYFTVEKNGRASIRKYMDKAALSGTISITDPRECKIAGTLYLPAKTGTAPEGTELMLKVNYGNLSAGRNVKVSKEGKFEFGQLPPGKVDIMLASTPMRGENGKWITGDPYPWALPAQLGVEVSPETVKNLDLVLVPGAVIKGKVIDKKTSKPYANARLNIDHPGRPESAFNDWAATNDNGEFQVRVVAGHITVGVESLDSAGRQIYFQPEDRPSASVDVVDGEEKTDLAISVDPDDREDNSYSTAANPVTPDFELKAGSYDLTWDPEIRVSYRVYSMGRYNGSEAKSRMKKLPEKLSDKAFFAASSFDSKDDGLLYIILDRSDGKNIDAAYIDLNRNGDLSDDRPVEMRGNNYQKRTDWFKVPSHQGAKDDEGTDYPQEARLIIGDTGSVPMFMLDRKGAWKCEIDSGKGKVECVVTDTNNNGIYGDVSNGNNVGDIIFIDANGSGKVIVQPWGPQSFDLYKLTKVADKFYSITTNNLGSKLNIEPYTGAIGQLIVRGENIQGMKANVSSTSLHGENGNYTFENINDKPVSLPIGSYELQYCSMKLGGKLPMSWRSTSKIDVQEGKTASLPVNGKFSLAICKDQKELVFKQHSAQTINWDISIGGKIKLDSIGDQSRNQAPTVKFYNKAGKLMHTTAARFT